MSIVWIISFIGWILSFGALVFQIARKKQYISTANSNVSIRDYLVDYKVKLFGRFIRP